MKKFEKETIPFHLHEGLMYKDKSEELRDSAAFGRMLKVKADYLRKHGNELFRNDTLAGEDMIAQVEAKVEKRVRNLSRLYVTKIAKSEKEKGKTEPKKVTGVIGKSPVVKEENPEAENKVKVRNKSKVKDQVEQDQ